MILNAIIKIIGFGLIHIFKILLNFRFIDRFINETLKDHFV